jgi:thiamine biosynthesis lipoprotein
MRRARPLLGTYVEIDAAGLAGPALERAIEAAFGAVARVHRLMSFHDPESDLSRLNRRAVAEPVAVDRWTAKVLAKARTLFDETCGLFDCAVGAELMRCGRLPSHGLGNIASGTFAAVEFMSDDRIRFSAPIAIDLGGIAKGFAVDRALDVLSSFGIESAIVNAGGDLAAFGVESHAVHIRHPRNPAQLVCSVGIRNEALASSARRFDPFHGADTAETAVIDPATRRVPETVDGVSVRAPSCMIADALTKIVMIAGTEASDLLDHYRASALMISADGTLQISSDFHRAVHLAA